MLNESKKAVLNWFCNRYEEGQKDFFQIKTVHKAFKHFSAFYIRIILVELLEAGYLESVKFGKNNNYFRCFRVKLEPEAPGCDYYTERRRV